MARIFEERPSSAANDTEVVTSVLVSRRPKHLGMWFGGLRNLQSFLVGSFKTEFGGIDIGSHSVKFVLLGRERDRIVVKDVQIEKLAKLTAVERREEKEKELQNALMKIASRVKSKTKVGIALNDPSLFAEPIVVQRNSGKELKELVQKELSEKHLIDPAASFFDFVPTNAPDTLNNTQDLFVVAAPRELVYRQFGVAQSAGFRVLSVEQDARDLAREYLRRGVFSPATAVDALHVAVAVAARQDILVSWNFRHLVNRRRRAMVNEVNVLTGNPAIEILAPPEV